MNRLFIIHIKDLMIVTKYYEIELWSSNTAGVKQLNVFHFMYIPYLRGVYLK
jgi:uncharacterized membrane protein YagU involved in acid resistance